MARTQDPWSTIPTELAGLVLRRLHAHVDRVRFAAVCPQWRSAARQVQLPPPPPLLALKAGDVFYSMPRGEPLHFAGCNDFDTASGNWLVHRRGCDLLLVDPFSGATMTLPAPSSVHIPGEDEGEDCEDSHDSANEVDHDEGDDSRDGHDSADEGEDSESGHDSAGEVDDSEDSHDSANEVDDDEGDDSRDDHDSADEGEDSESGHDSAGEGEDSEDGSGYYTDESETLSMDDVIKLIVCSPNLIAALFKGSENNWIAVCRPGGSKWSVAWDWPLWITDMAFYQGRLYIVEYDEEDLLALDISVDDSTGDPSVSRIGRVICSNQFDDEPFWLRMLYLVESCGSLLLVRRRIFGMHALGEGQIHTFAGQCEPDVSIFKADFGRSQWLQVTSLADDQALFLGPCSRAICVPQGDSPGNRLWFLDDYNNFHQAIVCGPSRVAAPKPSSPLPKISWSGHRGKTGAAWLFPAN